MNISRNSWHYRMADFVLAFVDKSPSNSLCIYFWQVVLAPLVIFAGVAILLLCICALLTVFLYGCGAIINDLLVGLHILPESFKQVPGVFNYRAIPSSLLIDLTIALFISYKAYKRRRPEVEKSDEPKPQNFVFAFIKAKKQKVCPIINFKD